MADSDEIYRALLDGEISKDEAVRRLRVINRVDRHNLRRRLRRSFAFAVVFFAMTLGALAAIGLWGHTQ